MRRHGLRKSIARKRTATYLTPQSAHTDASAPPSNVTAVWALADATRFENYSDSGSTLTGKLATRYEVAPGIGLRAAASTGFREPSLAHSYYSAISTNFIGGVPFEVGTFPVSSPVAQALGANNLFDVYRTARLNASYSMASTPTRVARRSASAGATSIPASHTSCKGIGSGRDFAARAAF